MKDRKMSRREFLTKMALGVGALSLPQVLSGCAPDEETQTNLPAASAEQASEPQATAIQTDTQEVVTAPTLDQPEQNGENSEQPAVEEPTTAPEVVEEPVQDAGSESMENPYIAVARNGDPEQMVRAAVLALGGMERFVPAGADVIIKPNVCVAYHTYEYAATTNPWVVAALVKMSLEAGAKKVRVMDYPFGGTPEAAYEISGIANLVKDAGGEMITTVSNFKFLDTDIPDGVAIQQTKIFDDILNTDVVINVPIAKHHGLARLTLGMKNLLGVVWDRPAMHRKMGEKLTDLASRVRPTLTVIDAVRMLMANGPTGGSLGDVRQADTIIASQDVVAADSYGATLFDLKPDQLDYIRAATERGFGRSDLENLKVEEISVGV